MADQDIPYSRRRFYNANPQTITLEQCANHGASHRYYGWQPQLDPRWDQTRRKAYQDAYDNEEKGPSR